MKYDVHINGSHRSVEFTPSKEVRSRVSARVDGRNVETDAAQISPDSYSVLLDGRSYEVSVEELIEDLLVRVGSHEFKIRVVDPRSWKNSRSSGIELEGRQQVAAPMPGKIVSLLVTAGQKVEAGQGLLVIEAMKMQNELRSPKSGVVERLLVEQGQTVSAGQIVAVVA